MFFGSVGDAGASMVPSNTRNIFQKGIEVVSWYGCGGNWIQLMFVLICGTYFVIDA